MIRRKLLHSSSFRLALIYMALFASSALVLLGFLYWSTIIFMTQQTDTTIEADITGLSEQYRQWGVNGVIESIDDRLQRDPESSSVYLLASPTFKPLKGNLSAWPEGDVSSDGWLTFQFEDARVGGRVFFARARRFVLQGGFNLLVGRDTRELIAIQGLLKRAMLWGLVITFGLGLIGGVVMSRSMMKRIEDINQNTRGIIAGNLSQRIPLSGNNDDIDQLANNLNVMLDEIQRLMTGIQQVSDNIAHDLRTPLTRLRNRLESLQQQSFQDNAYNEGVSQCLEDADELLTTFAALLRIARIESGGQQKSFSSVELTELVNDAIELYEALAQDKQISIITKVHEKVTINGDRHLLFQAITNLIDNAIKYTPEKGEILLTLHQQANSAEFIIADSGPGIAIEERDKVLDRFYRSEPSRHLPGSGLGLSLVKAVAQLHKARLLLDDHETDKQHSGLKVSIKF